MKVDQSFLIRHIGIRENDIPEMLQCLAFKSLESFISAVVPPEIRTQHSFQLDWIPSEYEALEKLHQLIGQNQLFRSFIGTGYSNSILPAVIKRNIFENPKWYTSYTPYQPEIAQGRLEALLNFQTIIADLTGLPIANASLLDEATAAAEAMSLCYALKGKNPEQAFFVSKNCHPQTIAVVQTRAEPLGIRVIVGDHSQVDFKTPIFAVLLQYPGSDGVIDSSYEKFMGQVKSQGGLNILAADLLSLTLLKSPAELGADIAVGTSQRFGVPLGYGGPHAAFFATRDEFKRQIPGRIVGISKDVDGKPAIRLALQTREQHIRRDKATSNICTSQVLLAVIASMYAVFHGPEGLRAIAERIHELTFLLRAGLNKLGRSSGDEPFFDTLQVSVSEAEAEKVRAAATARKINLRLVDSRTFGISLNETTQEEDVIHLLEIFALATNHVLPFQLKALPEKSSGYPNWIKRTSPYLTHEVFHRYRSETEVLRYISQLERKDLSLADSMIPLGSCTMKLNATSEMLPVSWAAFSRVHPFVPVQQVPGYQGLFAQLEKMLQEITGFPGVSLQPNAGSQGEYAGLLAIRGYHQSRGHRQRNVCLIPKSAHGTNPASATMAGMRVVVIECDENGNIELSHLKLKAKEHRNELAALMVTYPSTHGVFEKGIKEVCKTIHENGGQVYMDGANMNAQIGLCRPGELGADVCHLNLHKTFCIPHGGGGPGMGPIGVAQHLIPFLPGHPTRAVSAAAWGSASILPISWMYISMMGAHGLKQATQIAILNANYIAKKLSPHYPVLYSGQNGLVAHECIFDLRDLKDLADIEVDDVAKRLMDYGFHSPTISFPVTGTLMVEPTESESKAELDRFCTAMIQIREEIQEIIDGKMERKNNLLKNAPHTAEQIVRTEWNRPYSRERAVFPAPWVKANKFWPSVGRINHVLGDRNLVCTCAPIEDYT